MNMKGQCYGLNFLMISDLNEPISAENRYEVQLLLVPGRVWHKTCLSGAVYHFLHIFR